MDPKMDNGMKIDSLALDETYDVLRELSPEEVIGIMDQLLCFEVRHYSLEAKANELDLI